MLLLIACSLSMLVIYAGMKLLFLTKKENQGVLFKCVSWFILLMGFLILFGVGIGGIIYCYHSGRMMMKNKHKMHDNWGRMHMKGQKGMKQYYHHNMMSEACCGEMAECCHPGMGHKMGMHRGYMKMGACGVDEAANDERCEMMKGMECKKDSVKHK